MAVATGTAILGASLLSTGAGLWASNKASEAQKEGAGLATLAQMESYYQQRHDLAPWREAGQWSVEELQRRIEEGPGEFKESPGYQFRVEEGVKALDRSASARGELQSGAHMKNVLAWGQEYGSNEHRNFLTDYYQSLAPLQHLAGLGQGSASLTAAGRQNMINQVSRNYLLSGEAEASGAINAANTISNAASRGAENYLMYPIYQKWAKQGG